VFSQFLAFPSVVEIIRQVPISEGDMRSATANIFYESLTEQEKLEFESINNLIQEKKLRDGIQVVVKDNLLSSHSYW